MKARFLTDMVPFTADLGKEIGTSHWTMERYVAMSLVPIIPVAMAFPTTVLDYTVSAAVILHVHW